MIGFEYCNSPHDFDAPGKPALEFTTSDIVKVFGHDEYMNVVSVIHDEEKLFVSCSTKQKFEVPFSSIEMQFICKEI